jgi:hypothetical protein
MTKRFTARIVAAVAFLTALIGSLALFPLIVGQEALATDFDQIASGLRAHPAPLPSERIEARLAFIRTALKITEAQTKPWDTLADVMRKQAKDRDAEIAAMHTYRDTRFTLIDRLEHSRKTLSAQATSLSEMLAALQPLYLVFSDEQKQIADDLFDHGFGGPGGMHRKADWNERGRGQPAP